MPEYSIILTPAVQREVLAAQDVYWSYSEQTYNKFTHDVNRALDFIEFAPRSFRRLDEFPEVRMKTISKRYPFAFYYVIRDDELEVIAFAFIWNKRDPKFINKLLAERLADL